MSGSVFIKELGITVTYLKDPTRQDVWVINPPIWHPNVFTGGYSIESTETAVRAKLMLPASGLKNPSNVDAAIQYAKDREGYIAKAKESAVPNRCGCFAFTRSQLMIFSYCPVCKRCLVTEAEQFIVANKINNQKLVNEIMNAMKI